MLDSPLHLCQFLAQNLCKVNKMKFDDLGDRMKSHESIITAWSLEYSTSKPIYARLDGRSFSKLTKGLRKPFDERMSSCMIYTTNKLVAATNAKIGYTQSDEISLTWVKENEESDFLFSGKILKLTSILASMASLFFSEAVDLYFGDNATSIKKKYPQFDCRILNLPSLEEGCNMFLWRALDARLNAISGAAQSEFSHKQLHKKNQEDMINMLEDKGINFNKDYPEFFKHGTFSRKINYTIETENGLVVRSKVIELPTPYFKYITNKVDFVYNNKDAEQ